MNIKKYQLNDGEYVNIKTLKNKIVLHHTAGSHNPINTINGWNSDRTSNKNKIRVATSFIIGGKSTTDGNTDYDGVIYQCFDDIYWAFHLGVKNIDIEKTSIGIETCNYGYLNKTSAGYLNYVNKIVPESDVCDLGGLFRGYRYYHKYTDNQLKSLKELILFLANKHNIDIQKGLISEIKKSNKFKAFAINNDALINKPGLYSHTNYRSDKFDMSPQDELIDMLLSL